jgi:hypothetical protein
MLIALLFWLLVLISCGHATIFGGKDGRWAAALIIAASVLTIIAARMGGNWGDLELARMVVDLGLLLGLYVLMVISRRYWPIWMTGFHLIAVITHLSIMIAPGFTPQIYRALQSFWAIPVLLALLLGVELDRRAAAAGSSRPDGRQNEQAVPRRG